MGGQAPGRAALWAVRLRQMTEADRAVLTLVLHSPIGQRPAGRDPISRSSPVARGRSAGWRGQAGGWGGSGALSATPALIDARSTDLVSSTGFDGDCELPLSGLLWEGGAVVGGFVLDRWDEPNFAVEPTEVEPVHQEVARTLAQTWRCWPRLSALPSGRQPLASPAAVNRPSPPSSCTPSRRGSVPDICRAGPGRGPCW